MNCTICDKRGYCLDSRPSEKHTTRRTYQCSGCKRRWVTHEIMVVKPTKKLIKPGPISRRGQAIENMTPEVVARMTTEQLFREIMKRTKERP